MHCTIDVQSMDKFKMVQNSLYICSSLTACFMNLSELVLKVVLSLQEKYYISTQLTLLT